MQSGLGRSAAGTRPAGKHWPLGRLCVLLLSLTASACANVGQLGNLTESRPFTVAFESVDGPPAAVSQKLAEALREEAGARQITVVQPGEATYRLRGYLAAYAATGGTTITWAWDVFGADQRRAFRLRGVEQTGGTARSRWDGASDQVLHKIARAGIEQLAGFVASSRPASAPAAVSAVVPPKQNRSMFAWIDDWTPEASGIFRILRREEPKPEPGTGTASNLPQTAAVPLPANRPEPSSTASEATLAFAHPRQ
jgi:hypothetical protein